MSKAKLTMSNLFGNAGFMGILRALYAYEDGLEYNELAVLLIGEETLRKMIEEKKGCLSTQSFLSIQSLAEIKRKLNEKIKKPLIIKPIYRIKSRELLYERLRTLGPGEGFHFIEKEGKRYKLTRNARDLLSTKWTLSSLDDSFPFETMISTGAITVYTDPTFVAKYQESQESKLNVDRILKDIENSWEELRTLIVDNYKEERRNTIKVYTERINNKKLLEEELKGEAELPLPKEDLLKLIMKMEKEFNEEIRRATELMKSEPYTIVVINPFDDPPKEDFLKFVNKTDPQDKISQIKVYSYVKLKNSSGILSA